MGQRAWCKHAGCRVLGSGTRQRILNAVATSRQQCKSTVTHLAPLNNTVSCRATRVSVASVSVLWCSVTFICTPLFGFGSTVLDLHQHQVCDACKRLRNHNTVSSLIPPSSDVFYHLAMHPWASCYIVSVDSSIKAGRKVFGMSHKYAISSSTIW